MLPHLLIRCCTIILLILSQLICTRGQCQETQLTGSIRKEVINTLKEKIRENYVLKEDAEQVNEKLTQLLDDGGYDEIGSFEDFASKLTDDIHKITNDLHFRIFYTGVPPKNMGHQQNQIVKDSIINDDILLISNIYKLSNSSIKEFDELLTKANDYRGLIIDLRECSGGDRKAILNICSYFFQKPILLVSYQDGEGKVEDQWTERNKRLNSLYQISLFILVSHKTASGGEALAYILKHHNRATIVGDTTLGAAHSVRTFDLGHKFRCFIPVIRPIHPVTKSNWQGTGVIPDVQVPQRNALEKAIELLK